MLNLDENCLNIYTDGASKDGPRRGGCAFRVVLIDETTGDEAPIDFSFGRYVGATNNQMELMACVQALEEVSRNDDLIRALRGLKRIVIYTDSKYIQENYQTAMYDWSTSDWEKAGGSVVKNIKLWKKINTLRRRISGQFGKNVSFVWVKAHQKGEKKDRHNDVVDKLAQNARELKKVMASHLIPFTDVRKKGVEERTVIGSIGMLGQKEKIYIVQDETLKKGKYLYRCKVIGQKSPFYNCIDFIESADQLQAGHFYDVRLGSKKEHPQILEANEIEKS